LVAFSPRTSVQPEPSRVPRDAPCDGAAALPARAADSNGYRRPPACATPPAAEAPLRAAGSARRGARGGPLVFLGAGVCLCAVVRVSAPVLPLHRDRAVGSHGAPRARHNATHPALRADPRKPSLHFLRARARAVQRAAVLRAARGGERLPAPAQRRLRRRDRPPEIAQLALELDGEHAGRRGLRRAHQVPHAHLRGREPARVGVPGVARRRARRVRRAHVAVLRARPLLPEREVGEPAEVQRARARHVGRVVAAAVDRAVHGQRQECRRAAIAPHVVRATFPEADERHPPLRSRPPQAAALRMQHPAAVDPRRTHPARPPVCLKTLSVRPDFCSHNDRRSAPPREQYPSSAKLATPLRGKNGSHGAPASSSPPGSDGARWGGHCLCSEVRGGPAGPGPARRPDQFADTAP
jgi:hypothetical protein